MENILVTIHASLDFKNEIIIANEFLVKNSNFTIILPDLNRYQHIRDEYGDDIQFTKIKTRLTHENMNNVARSDVLLILNHTHRGFENYIGGNSFLEMAIAFYLKKPIYLINPIPETLPYTEEIKALNPIIANSLEDFIKLASIVK